LIGKKILVIDDEPLMCRLIRSIFVQEGAEVETALDGNEGLQKFSEKQPDLVLLDIMLPGIDGWEVCRQIRRQSDVPIVMLSALNRQEDIVRGLDSGADDYVTKPFSHDVLLARAESAIRRTELQSAMQSQAVYDDGYLQVDLDRQSVIAGGKSVHLNSTEFELLTFMLQNAGRVCTFAQILENVWGEDYRSSAEYVHVYIWQLRQKLEKDPKRPTYLVTEHSIGYRFEESEDATN
jgi:two-component system KDP operon response regulator KdpE